VQALSEEYDLMSGETTADGLFSLTTARCLGSCGLAPVIVMDGQVRGKETPEGVMRQVKETLALSKESREVEAEAG
jgi:bidirectional [NiFe] hydrogenase diaphorase subunit